MSASPQLITFALYDNTGAPLVGATPTFTGYVDQNGSNVTQPAISSLGHGLYKFAPVFTAGQGIAYHIDGGASATPRYLAGYLRPEDYNPDLIPAHQAISQGIDDWNKARKEIATSGPDLGKLIVYQNDGVTVRQKFQLFDKDGAISLANAPFKIVPTS